MRRSDFAKMSPCAAELEETNSLREKLGSDIFQVGVVISCLHFVCDASGMGIECSTCSEVCVCVCVCVQCSCIHMCMVCVPCIYVCVL